VEVEVELAVERVVVVGEEEEVVVVVVPR
jgi:hypothetical protein